jgi:alpha-L-fucosidase
MLSADQQKCLVRDIERGASNKIEAQPWETDTCIGNWHYDRSLYEKNHYKSAKTVIQMLCDIVSKNGDLLLNIPVRGDGSIDDKEQAVLAGIGAWMDVNGNVFSTRVRGKFFGEGPASEGVALSAQGFNEGKGKPFTAEDVRFTTKGDTLYAIVLGTPQPVAPATSQPVTPGTPRQDLQVKSLGTAAKLLDKPIGNITLLGSDEKVEWTQMADALIIKAPAKSPNNIAIVYKMSNGANWLNGTVATGSGNAANFNQVDLTADPTVIHLDSARTIGNLIFGDINLNTAAGWVLDNNGTPGNIFDVGWHHAFYLGESAG